MKIAVLVLAAGKSSRMKSPKQLVTIGTNFLIEYILSKAKSIEADEVYCVLGANSEIILKEISSPDVHFFKNKDFEKGLSESLSYGVSEIEKQYQNYDGILVLLGDQPTIEKEYLNNMIMLFNKNKNKIVASNYGKKLGVPALFHKKYFQDLKNISGDTGAQKILNENLNVISPIMKTEFLDIDTEKDYQDFKNSILN
ncbi:nucleotidyltransferase family protein [Polaribacter sp. OB-PA-B3]